MMILTKNLCCMADYLLSSFNVYLAVWLHSIEAELKVILVMFAIILSGLRIISIVKKEFFTKNNKGKK